MDLRGKLDLHPFLNELEQHLWRDEECLCRLLKTSLMFQLRSCFANVQFSKFPNGSITVSTLFADGWPGGILTCLISSLEVKFSISFELKGGPLSLF